MNLKRLQGFSLALYGLAFSHAFAFDCAGVLPLLRDDIPTHSAAIIAAPENPELLERHGLAESATREALRLNIETTKHKQRKGGTPYPDHPTRLALLLRQMLGDIWPKELLEHAMQEALVHDSLEEGAGVSAKSIRALLDQHPHFEGVIRAAIILTEPALRYPSYESTYMVYHRIEKIAVLLQSRAWVKAHPSKATSIVAALLADKLINILDKGYIDSSWPPEKLEEKLVFQIGSMLYAYELLKPVVQSLNDRTGGLDRLLEVFKLSINQKIQDFKVPAEKVLVERDILKALETKHSERLLREIAQNLAVYHDQAPNLDLKIVP